MTKPETTTGTLFTVVATPTTDGANAVEYAFDTNGNPGTVADATISNGAVTLASGKHWTSKGRLTR